MNPAGGTFALYSLITRYAHIATPSGSPNASDLHLSRYTSNSRVEASGRQGPKTTSEKVLTYSHCIAPKASPAHVVPGLRLCSSNCAP